MPERSIPREAAYQIINDELMLDGNPRLNLASFVTTWMEPECDKLIMDSVNKNYVDMDEYPVTTELQVLVQPCTTTQTKAQIQLLPTCSVRPLLNSTYRQGSASLLLPRLSYFHSMEPLKSQKCPVQYSTCQEWKGLIIPSPQTFWGLD
jgi:hypothetical protein